MSYVLTEIALEMLGYKYYDINGDYKKTSFQDNSQMEQTDDDETNLAVLLGCSNETPNTDKTVKRSNTTTINKSYTPNLTNYMLQMDTNAFLIETSKNFQELIHAEYIIVCRQFEKNNSDSIRSNESKISKVEQCNRYITKDFITNYINQETKFFAKKLDEITKFRQHVESRLIRVNPRLFEKYTEVLKKCRASTKFGSDDLQQKQ